MDKKTNIDLVTGFLGAGKTTLILEYASYLIGKGEKIVIIENEIGEKGIDGSILEGGGLSVRELANGCICCTMRLGFEQTLFEIYEDIRPDRVIVEPTGVFITEDFLDVFKSEFLKNKYELGTVVAVVDAQNFRKVYGAYGHIFDRQISISDTIYLNKTENMTNLEIFEATEALNETAKDREIIIGGLSEFSEDDWLNLFRGRTNAGKSQGHTHSHMTHGRLKAIGFASDIEFTQDELSGVLESAAAGKYGKVFRAKGFVKGKDGNTLFFSTVFDDIEVSVKDEPNEMRAVFIGEDLEVQKLKSIFENQ